MLVHQDGNKKEIISKDKALEIAKTNNLDLVQVSPNGSDPAVCKLLDYGKYVFDKKKKVASSKSKIKRKD